MTVSKRTKPEPDQYTPAPIGGSAGAETGAASTPEIAALKDSLNRMAQTRISELTRQHELASFFPQPDNMARALESLRLDLSEVPVIDSAGRVTNPYNKINDSPLLKKEDKALIWRCLAVVRQAFFTADGREYTGTGGYQWNMNWKHTRAEIDQVLEAAKLLGLPSHLAAEAILASIFSDSVKNRGNFITHNIDGACGAAEVLFRFVSKTDASGIKRVERIVQAVREHQIAPPEFMGRAAAIMICHKLKLPKFDPRTFTPYAHDEYSEQHRLITQIFEKIADPFNKAHLADDLRTIAFCQGERELLHLIGVKEWYVPHPENEDARPAHAVIAGDHSINYNHPEGFAKIALIRGPDTEAIFEDPTVLDSLYSAVHSFTDSFRVLLPEVQPMAIAGLRRTQTAVERVTAIMRELFCGVIIGPRESSRTGAEKVARAIERAHARQPQLFTVECTDNLAASQICCERAIIRVGDILQDWLNIYGEIPFNQKNTGLAEPGAATLPFWSAPLVYPERDSNGTPQLDSLTELQRKQFLFAAKIREIAVELLRAEQWIY